MCVYEELAARNLKTFLCVCVVYNERRVHRPCMRAAVGFCDRIKLYSTTQYVMCVGKFSYQIYTSAYSAERHERGKFELR